ncbi:Fc.00g069330.m01.CDS01 [Cosmosporella sp. VM-42]
MHARDASGRKVSLLNDDSSSFVPQRPLSFQSTGHALSYPTPGSLSSSPNTPELLRSDSYDSSMSTDPISPMTPGLDYYSRQSAYGIPHEYGIDAPPAKRPAYANSSRSASFDDDMSNSATSPMPNDRPGKRYPCRYRESHGCEKTFTTSGHASRHSKIHTAEKAVQCTYPGCQKKFTRADNMKQHLETHYKDKSRSSGQRAPKSALAETRRNSSSSRSSASGRSSARDSKSHWETEQYALPTPPLRSPNPSSGAWDMRGLNLPLLNRPVAGRTPSGLDTLAMAIACQEGAS